MPVDGPSCRDRVASKLARHGPSSRISAKKLARHPLQPHFREEVRPTRHIPPILSHFSCAERTFSHLHDHYSAAGRTFSRTRRDNVATLKPTTPLLAPNKGPLKPTTPLRPKTAPKTPISHPQRRWRFQSRLGRRPQRQQGFQTTGPAGLQGQSAEPMGDGGDWPGDQWAANVTNVVKPTRFQSPRENPCYKRRQSKPKNHHYQRKSPQIDDVRNNGAEIHTKNTLD